jgi:hypothetical protein
VTTCELITKPIMRMVEQEGKSLDDIAASVCPTVKYGREKIIRVIKDFLGEEYLIQHADTLKYDIEKAKLARKRKSSHKKIPATADDDSKASSNPTKTLSFDEVVDTLEEIIKRASITIFISALDTIKERHEELQ